MTTLRIFVSHNKLLLPECLEVDPTKISIKELRDLAFKAAKITASIASHKFYVTSYLTDVITLNEQEGDFKESQFLNDVGMKSMSTLFIISLETGSKPRRRKNPKISNEEVEVSDNDDFSMDIDDVIKVYEKTSDKKKRQAIFKFGAANAEKVVETKGFTDASKETLIAFLKDDTLAIEEGPLFDAVIRWAKKKAKSDDIKSVLTEDIMKNVRFPLMLTSDIATKVIPLSILEMQQALDLFSYTSAFQASKAKDKDVKAPPLPKTLSIYGAKPRVPSRKPSRFGTVSTATPIITLSNDNKTATHASGGSGHNWVLGEELVKSGKREWKVRIDTLESNNWIMLGVTNSLPGSGAYSYSWTGNYGLASAQQVYKGGASTSCTHSQAYYQAGNTVSCLLDLTALTFTIRVIETGFTYVLDALPSGHSWYFHVNLHGSNDQVTLLPV